MVQFYVIVFCNSDMLVVFRRGTIVEKTMLLQTLACMSSYLCQLVIIFWGKEQFAKLNVKVCASNEAKAE